MTVHDDLLAVGDTADDEAADVDLRLDAAFAAFGAEVGNPAQIEHATAAIGTIVTYTIDNLGTNITSLPENEEKTNIHAIGHAGGDLNGRAAHMRDVIKTYHMKQVHTLVTKLGWGQRPKYNSSTESA